MPAARPETLALREARDAAKDGLRVTVQIGGMTLTFEPVASTPDPDVASAEWDEATGQ